MLRGISVTCATLLLKEMMVETDDSSLMYSEKTVLNKRSYNQSGREINFLWLYYEARALLIKVTHSARSKSSYI